MLRRSLRSFCASRFVLCAVLGSTLFVACGTPEKPDLTISRVQPDGFPVPEGFRFLEGRSYSYRSGQFESATYVWSGREELDAIADFYRRRMPDHGWRAAEQAFCGAVSRPGSCSYRSCSRAARSRACEAYGS